MPDPRADESAKSHDGAHGEFPTDASLSEFPAGSFGGGTGTVVLEARRQPGASLRTWLILIAIAAVLGALAFLAPLPQGVLRFVQGGFWLAIGVMIAALWMSKRQGEWLRRMKQELDAQSLARNRSYVDGLNKEHADELTRRDGEIKKLQQLPELELRRRAADLVWFMHRHYFSDSNKIDPDYRLSLFLLAKREEDRKAWVCYARSGSIASSRIKEWPHVTDPSLLERSGLLAWCKYEGAGLTEVPGIPIERRGNRQLILEYQAKCKISLAEWEDRTWKFATLGLYLARREGRVPFVLVIERESGHPIQPKAVDGTEEIKLRTLVQLAAEFWCAPEGEFYAQLSYSPS